MINISYKKNPELYEDYKKCLEFLATIKPESHEWPDHLVNFHHYSEVTNTKQLLAIESYFSTQNLEHTKLVLWSDWNVQDNPLIARFKDKIDFRIFDPIAESVGTILDGQTDVLLADDTKHYMKSGLLRFLAGYKYGGIWFDMDMVLLNDLKPILDQEFAYVWAREYKDFTKYGPCAALMNIHKESEHARACLEELAKAPILPNSVARDCDMLKGVYKRRPFTVFPSAFFNMEWQIPEKATAEPLRSGWFTKNEESTNLGLSCFAWHWHGSGGTKSTGSVQEGSKFDLIQKHIKARLKPSISFIFCTRNDGYGDNLGVYPVEGVKEINLERIATTLRALHYLNIPGQEILLMDCFPPKDRQTCTELFRDYARVMTIPDTIRDQLHAQVKYKMPMYEFLAKHIGAVISKSDRLFFCNSDDIFRRVGIEKSIADIDAGLLARADRVGVRPDVIRNDAKLKQYVDDATPFGIPGITQRLPGAGGDYFGIRRDIYFKTGGWRVAHGEWDLDAEYIRRLTAQGIQKVQEDTFYHIEHYTEAVSQHRDTPNRPPRVDGEKHTLIRDLDSIIAQVLKFNNIV